MVALSFFKRVRRTFQGNEPALLVVGEPENRIDAQMFRGHSDFLEDRQPATKTNVLPDLSPVRVSSGKIYQDARHLPVR